LEKFTIAAGVAFRYSDTEKGDDSVILLHGYLETLDVWDQWSQLLAQRYRVISLDLPGHGISEVKGGIHTMKFLAETVHGLIENLGLKRYFVIGHSMGGYVAMEMMKYWQSEIKGVIFLHSHPFADSEKRAEDRQREIELMLSGRKEVLVNINPQRRFAVENCKRLESVIDELKEMASLIEDEGIIAILRGISQRGDYLEIFKSETAPSLFIFGTQDQMIPAQAVKLLIEQLPQVSVVQLEHSGHMSFIEQPEDTFNLVAEFIDKNR
jgi:pimeloyl-ACP methyl ester carboxylesterase